MRSYEQYLQDLEQLTGIPVYMLRYLLKVFKLLVCHEIYECMIDDKSVYESKCLGIGKLQIEFNNDTDDYTTSLVLSKNMKSLLDKMLDEQKSPLLGELDKAYINKITSKFVKVLENE